MVELSREAEDNATSRGLHRIPPPAEETVSQLAFMSLESAQTECGFSARKRTSFLLRSPAGCASDRSEAYSPAMLGRNLYYGQNIQDISRWSI